MNFEEHDEAAERKRQRLSGLIPGMSIIRKAILAFALVAGLAQAFAQSPPPVPALPDTERRTSYVLSSSRCTCAVNFALYGDSTDYGNWIEVWLNGMLVPSSNYTITSATGPLATIPRPITDAVLTFNQAQTGTVQIVGARRPRRTAQFQESRGVAARDLNQALTDIVAQNRETWDRTNDVAGRALLAPPGETLAALPPANQRANQGAAFDAFGNLTAGTMPSSGMISASMQPVVSAATLALARAAMGLGAIATEGIGCGLVDDGAGNARFNPAISQIAVNTAIHKANCFQSLITTGPITLTLDRANITFNGFGFWVYNTAAGAVTLTPDANDTFQGYATGASVNLPPNTQAFISTDAATLGNWTVQYALATAPPMVTGGFNNLLIKNNAGTPNTQVDVTADALVIPNALAGGARHTSVSFTINTANTGVNGMDVGTLPASSWVYVWAISNGATVGGLVSASSSAPTMPSGYVYRYRIGAMRTDSSNRFMRTRQQGDRAVYVVTSGSNTATLPNLTNSGSTAWTALSVSGFVPPTASQIKLQLFVATTNNVDGRIGVVPNNSYATSLAAPTLMGYSNFSAPGGSPSGTINQVGEITLESSNIYYGTQNGLTAMSLNCYGWTDNL